MSCDRPLAIQPICPKPDCSWTQFRDDQRLGLPPAVAAWSAPSSCIQGPAYSQPQAADTALLPERPFRQATRDSYLVACMVDIMTQAPLPADCLDTFVSLVAASECSTANLRRNLPIDELPAADGLARARRAHAAPYPPDA